jgi:hypothetical protein
VSPRLHTHTDTWAEVSSPAQLHIFQSPQKRSSPPGSPAELLHRERSSISRALSTYLSKSPEKKPPSRIPLQSPYIKKDAPSPEPSSHISQSPQKRNAPSKFPLRSPCIKKDCSISRDRFVYLSKPPEKTLPPPSRFPLWSPYIEKDVPSPEPSIHIFQSSQKRSPPPDSLSEPHRNRCSVLRTFLYLSLKVPSERAPPQVPSQSPHREG